MIERLISAPRETVWQVLTDHAHYQDFVWFIQRSTDLGGKRAMRIGGITVYEHVVEAHRPERFVYSVPQRVPVRDYRGTVTLHDLGEQTHLRWTISGRPYAPGVMVGLGVAVRLLASDIARESERRFGFSQTGASL